MVIPEYLVVPFVLAFMTIGLFGLLLPIFPGLVVIWLATLGYALLTGFTTIAWIFFVIITILMIIGSLIDNFIMGQQAFEKGASWISIIVAMTFGVLGNFVIPVIGGFLGALLALFLTEWIRRKNWKDAVSAARGWAIGWGWAIVIRFLIGLLMVGLWIFWVIV